MAFDCDSELLILNVIQPLRTYHEKTPFHVSFQEKSVRFEEDQGASKSEATFRGSGLCASCPIEERTTNLTEIERLQLAFARHQIAVAGALVALVHRVDLAGETRRSSTASRKNSQIILWSSGVAHCAIVTLLHP